MGKVRFYFFLFLFVIILGGGFVLFGDLISFTSDVHHFLIKTNYRQQLLDKIMFWTQKTEQPQSLSISVPNISLESPNSDWCKPTELIVDDYMEEPISSKIIGWDNTSMCCIREVFGFNCALNKNATVTYCYTSNLNGVNIYVKVNNITQELQKLNLYIEDLDKVKIDNKPCDIGKYVGTKQ